MSFQDNRYLRQLLQSLALIPCSMTSLRSNWNASAIPDFNSSSLLHLLIPTLEPRLAGFTNTGYVNLSLTNLMILFSYFSYSLLKS